MLPTTSFVGGGDEIVYFAVRGRRRVVCDVIA